MSVAGQSRRFEQTPVTSASPLMADTCKVWVGHKMTSRQLIRYVISTRNTDRHNSNAEMAATSFSFINGSPNRDHKQAA
jgi:hypothetical protein